jgi:hypothetical protein
VQHPSLRACARSLPFSPRAQPPVTSSESRGIVLHEGTPEFISWLVTKMQPLIYLLVVFAALPSFAVPTPPTAIQRMSPFITRFTQRVPSSILKKAKGFVSKVPILFEKRPVETPVERYVDSHEELLHPNQWWKRGHLSRTCSRRSDFHISQRETSYSRCQRPNDA